MVASIDSDVKRLSWPTCIISHHKFNGWSKGSTSSVAKISFWKWLCRRVFNINMKYYIRLSTTVTNIHPSKKPILIMRVNNVIWRVT